jgi:hypothetical protein
MVHHNGGTLSIADTTTSPTQPHRRHNHIADTTMMENTGRHWTVVSTGSVTNVGSAVGTSAKSITVTNSALQDLP